MFGWSSSSSGSGGGGGGGGSSNLTLQQTGFFRSRTNTFCTATDQHYIHSSSTGTGSGSPMTAAGDMPCGYRSYSCDPSHYFSPMFKFSTAGMVAGDVTSATLTLTIAAVNSSYAPDNFVLACGRPRDDINYGTIPNATSFSNTGGGFLTDHSFAPYAHWSTTAATNADYDLGYHDRYDLSGVTWSVGQTITLDVTAMVRSYFLNPSRVNNTELCFYIPVDRLPSYFKSGSNGQPGTSSWSTTAANHLILAGENHSSPPTLSVAHSPETRSRIAVSSDNDSIGHHKASLNNQLPAMTSSFTNISGKDTYSYGGLSTENFFKNYRRRIGSYGSNYTYYNGYLNFPIANEVQQGDTLKGAYLSFFTRTNSRANYNNEYKHFLFGDKSGTVAKPTSFTDNFAKTATTASAELKGQGSVSGRQKYHSIMDVTAVVQEIISDSSWDGNALQFLSRPEVVNGYIKYSTNKQIAYIYRLTTTGASQAQSELFTPILSLHK